MTSAGETALVTRTRVNRGEIESRTVTTVFSEATRTVLVSLFLDRSIVQPVPHKVTNVVTTPEIYTCRYVIIRNTEEACCDRDIPCSPQMLPARRANDVDEPACIVIVVIVRRPREKAREALVRI